MYYDLQKKPQFVFSIKIDGKSSPLVVHQLSSTRFLFQGKHICDFYTAKALVKSVPAPNEKKQVRTIFCQKQKYSTNYVYMSAGEYRKFINEFKEAFNIQIIAVGLKIKNQKSKQYIMSKKAKPKKKKPQQRKKAVSSPLGEDWPIKLPRQRRYYCECGDYRPKSREGLINTDCANCGGVYRPKVYG